MVGDAPGDIQMAKNAGAAGAIGICWGEEPIEPLWGADATISSLEALEITAR
jgi:phosphoglycolate phosphatase